MLKGLKSTARSSAIYGLGNISTKLIGIVLMPLFTDTNILSVNDYGVLGVVDVTIQVLVSLLGLSLYQAYFRWYWDKKYSNERESIFFTILVFITLIGTMAFIAGCIASKGLSLLFFSNPGFSKVLVLMLFSVFLQVISQLPLSLMRLEEKPAFYTITNITRLLVTLVLTILFITRLNRGLEGIYEAQVIGNIGFLIIVAKYIYNRSALKIKIIILRDMLVYSLPLTVASVSGVVLVTLDRFVLNYRATLLDVGIYTTAYRFANTIRVFIVHSLQLALAPTIFKLMNHPDNRIIYARIMTYFSVMVVYASLALSVFSPEILDLFVTDKVYHRAFLVIPILSLGILLGTIKDVAINGLNIAKKTMVVSIIVPVVAAFHLGLSYVLIPLIGVYGAATSSTISQLLVFLFVLYFAQKYYPIPYQYYRIVVPVIIAIALFVVGYFVNALNLWPRFAAKIILVSAFPLILWIINYFESDEKQWVKGWVKKWLMFKM